MFSASNSVIVQLATYKPRALKKRILKLFKLASILSLFFSINVIAAQDASNAQNTDDSERSLDKPSLNMQVNIEVEGLDESVLQASKALKDISQSIQQMANQSDLSPQQEEHFEMTLSAVEHLSVQLDKSLQQLPSTITQSTKPIIDVANQLSSEVKKWVLIILVGLVVLVVVALLAIYYSVLAPTGKAVISATKQLNQLATSLKVTAQLVEQTAAQNQSLLERLDNAHHQTQSNSVKADPLEP